MLDGVSLYHLWFLFDLLIFTGIAAIIFQKPGLFKRFGCWLEKQPILMIFSILAGCSFIASLVTRSTGISYDMLLGLTNLARLAEYGPFFAIGIFMFRSSEARITFTRIPILYILMTLPLALIAREYSYDHGFLTNELALFVQFLMTWSSVAIILSLFYKFMLKSNHLTRMFSDAAYTVYLFHHVIVVMVGVALFSYQIDIWLKFIIVCATSLSCSLLIHILLIRPNRVARLLFNGKLPAENDKQRVRIKQNHK
jgi:glucan biosynthesis protein C